MTTTTDIRHFQKQIERLVREHIAMVKTKAAEALERSFALLSPKRSSRSRNPAARTSSSRRRGPDEIAALGERLYQAVRSHPGATMAMLAPRVGASARELNRSMRMLKQAGRLKSVGERQATRYFPMPSKSAP